MPNGVAIPLPSVITLEGRQERGSIWVLPAGKAPKLRFEPGSFIRYKRVLYQIVYAFRTAANPSEWLYSCEERTSLVSSEPSELFPGLTEALGAGETTPRVVREVFHNEQQAQTFFSDIPIGRNRVTLSNKKLLQGAQVVSSGELLDAESPRKSGEVIPELLD